MGIRGLTALISKYVPEAIKINSINHYKNSTIAVDTSILLHKFCYSGRKNSHIDGFMKKYLMFISHNIVPIFVIDGKPPKEKKYILNKRKKQKNKIRERIDILRKNITDDNKFETTFKISKLNRQIINISEEQRDEVKTLLKLLGVCVVNSKGEAEVMCAKLQKCNKVDYVLSDDTDLLPLGCMKLLRTHSNNMFMEISMDILLKGLNVTYKEFIDLCILCGCDFCPIKYNYNKAYGLIQKYKTMENIPEINKNVIDIRKLFKRDEECTLDDKLKINSIKFDEEKFLKFLLKKKYSKKYLINYINKVKNILIK